MVIRVNRFTPEALLGATRRSPGAPSPDGKYALYTCSTYSFKSHSNTSEICVLDIDGGTQTVVSRNGAASEPKWLGEGYELIWLKQGENGNTSLVISDATNPTKSYTAGTISGPVSNLKLYNIRPGMVAVAVAGQANPDGGLYNPKDAPKFHSTARVYDSLMVTHWDKFEDIQRNAIFTGLLQKTPSTASDKGGRFNLIGFTNALKGTGLECPIPPFGGTDHFDIGSKGLVIVAKDPEIDPSTHTKCNAYFIPREDLMDMSVVKPVEIKVPGFEGAASCPIFSPDGKSVALLKMKEDGYESDKNRIVVAHGLATYMSGVDVVFPQNASGWDRSPSSMIWSHDGGLLYLIAEDQGAVCLFKLSLAGTPGVTVPEQLTFGDSVSNVVLAAKGSSNLFISGTSLVDNSIYTILDPIFKARPISVSSMSQSGNSFGLSRDQIKSFWWIGDKNRPVHALVMLPSFFNPQHKYPLAYLVHGGPQGAWNDQWSTRWNPAIFAEQGYVVVCPNITGSTGYGQAFTDAIQRNWGGSPYIDLVKGFEHIEKEHSYIDTSRAVALGASYGGYMMNWLQGHPLGRKFKALVCHDGGFSMSAQLGSDEQYFPVHEMGGPIWERQEEYDKWDPSRHTKNWQTPMLVIHSNLDYRLLVVEGLAAFNILQMRGVESRFLNFPDENHWVLKQENSLVWHLVVLNWINKFVGLPRVVDQHGSDGDGYVRRGKR